MKIKLTLNTINTIIIYMKQPDIIALYNESQITKHQHGEYQVSQMYHDVRGRVEYPAPLARAKIRVNLTSSPAALPTPYSASGSLRAAIWMWDAASCSSATSQIRLKRRMDSSKPVETGVGGQVR